MRLVVSLKEEKLFFLLQETTSRTSRGLGVPYSTKLCAFGHNLSYLEPVLGWSWACLGLSRSVFGLSWACLEHYSAGHGLSWAGGLGGE